MLVTHTRFADLVTVVSKLVLDESAANGQFGHGKVLLSFAVPDSMSELTFID
jgi:hypothetical protein